MTVLDACTSFCTAMSSTIGPTLTEILLGGLGLLLVWWRNRKHVASVLAPVVARADAAEKKASAADLELAEIKGSLRPIAHPSPSPLPVIMPELDPNTPKPRPSMADPSLSGEAAFPRPSNLPSFDRDTPRETPSAKGRP